MATSFPGLREVLFLQKPCENPRCSTLCDLLRLQGEKISTKKKVLSENISNKSRINQDFFSFFFLLYILYSHQQYKLTTDLSGRNFRTNNISHWDLFSVNLTNNNDQLMKAVDDFDVHTMDKQYVYIGVYIFCWGMERFERKL